MHPLLSLSFLAMAEMPDMEEKDSKSMNWYQSLDINTRINAKECFELLCGVKFEKLSFLIPFNQRIKIMYDKLKMEGFQVD